MNPAAWLYALLGVLGIPDSLPVLSFVAGAAVALALLFLLL